MKTRLFVVLAGAVSLLGLGLTACTTDDTTGTGGTGGTGGNATTTTTTTTTTTSNGPGGGGGAGGGVGGGGGAGGACVTCGEALDDAVTPFCDQEADDLYTAAFDCACLPAPDGACEAVCGANICVGEAGDQACQDCLDATVDGCKVEFDACKNDT
jgi:hypothetical protein